MSTLSLPTKFIQNTSNGSGEEVEKSKTFTDGLRDWRTDGQRTARCDNTVDNP